MYHILQKYRQTSNITHTLVGNKTVDHPDVVGLLIHAYQRRFS